MLQDALHAKAMKPTTRTPLIASIVELPSETTNAPDLVATLFPASANMTSEYGTSDTSEISLSSVSDVPSLKGKHFTWDCSLMNDADHIRIKVQALIDSGAHLVLICPDIVSCLRLTKLLLPHPEQILVTIGNNTKQTQIMHFVLIKPSILDGMFTSTPL